MIDLHWIFQKIVNPQCKFLSFDFLHSETILDIALVVVFLENLSKSKLPVDVKDTPDIADTSDTPDTPM